MVVKAYANFDLLLLEEAGYYHVRVTDSPAGQASRTFQLPFSALELENFILKLGKNRANVRTLQLDRANVPSIKKLGSALYECLFKEEVGECFRSSLALAKHQDKGLRIRLRFSAAPTLIDIPWELLFDAASNQPLGLSVNTPIIRTLDLAILPETKAIQGTLCVLVMIASPQGYQPLEVEREWQRITEATKNLQTQGKLVLERIEPSLAALQRRLRRGAVHVFHYIGHGGYDQTQQDGVLVLENVEGKGHLVSGQYLGAILYDYNLQLALLNSCNGARTSVMDPFAGVGQSLLQKGIPAVIAMQFEITDTAAITFAHEFYAAIADGYSIEAAVAEARKMIYAQANPVEWATPVLYASVDGIRLVEPDNRYTTATKPPEIQLKMDEPSSITYITTDTSSAADTGGIQHSQPAVTANTLTSKKLGWKVLVGVGVISAMVLGGAQLISKTSAVKTVPLSQQPEPLMSPDPSASTSETLATIAAKQKDIEEKLQALQEANPNQANTELTGDAKANFETLKAEMAKLIKLQQVLANRTQAESAPATEHEPTVTPANSEIAGVWKGILTDKNGKTTRETFEISAQGNWIYEYETNQGITRRVEFAEVGQNVVYVPVGGGITSFTVKGLERRLNGLTILVTVLYTNTKPDLIQTQADLKYIVDKTAKGLNCYLEVSSKSEGLKITQGLLQKS